MEHVPVLLQEILAAFNPKSGDTFVDATANGGGHLLALAERVGPNGTVIGIEYDPDIFKRLQEKVAERKFRNVILVNDSYANLSEIIRRHRLRPIAGILFDLGMSSLQLGPSGRGFSFMHTEPLDMRFNSTATDCRASDIVNHATRDELMRILKEYGEERFARKIADRITEVRKSKPIRTTTDLVRVIGDALPAPARRGRIHFATRTFQALRIAVNREFETIQKGIEAALETITPGGTIAVISFHSLEDRIIKNAFRDAAKNHHIELITKKPLIPTREEINHNPRARSAKLRIVKKAKNSL